MKTAFFWTPLALAACSELPKDPDGTLERVRTSKVLRTGIILEAGNSADSVHRRFLRRVAGETGSQPRIITGSAEQLLPKIERGELDIVVGRFGPSTPWTTRVTIVPAAEETDEEETASAAIVRNGENRWIALVHKHAQKMEDPSQ